MRNNMFRAMLNICMSKDVVNYKLRDELAMRAREQEKEDEERECTFKPHLRKGSLMATAKSKYKDIAYKPEGPTNGNVRILLKNS
jgi:hypothetical protein